MSRDRWRRRVRWLAASTAVTATVLTIACWPVSRLAGVNFVVTRQTLPLWAKVVNFIDRDANLARVARGVLGHEADADAKAAAALAWTRTNIRNTPAGMPIVDDHVWHIVVRGYGQPDQQADVFTTLLSYAEVPAYWQLVGGAPEEVPISYVWIRGRWRLYDVTRGVVFRQADGDLATPERLAADPGLVLAAALAAGLDADRYADRFRGYRPPLAPEVTRAELQMPMRRVAHELRRMMGLERRGWEMRQR